MESGIISILIIIILFLCCVHLRNTFKISYYQTVCEIHGYKDTVKGMPWYKLYLK